jgi:hypothetical protein
MNVCPLRATELALSDDANVWERPLGLQGVWGNLICEWLDQLVPEDAEERVKKRGEVGCAFYALYHSRSFIELLVNVNLVLNSHPRQFFPSHRKNHRRYLDPHQLLPPRNLGLGHDVAYSFYGTDLTGVT